MGDTISTFILVTTQNKK